MVDTLASEYGWTKDYILYEVYPLEAFLLFPQIASRQLNAFVDQLEIQILTDSNIEGKDRQKWLAAVDGMRAGSGNKPPERELDRSKLEQLRKVMGKRKGKAPQRVE